MVSLTFDPLRTQAERWNLSYRKDQREILCLIRKKRPKHVIGYGRCILLCTVLCHEQITRGAWFLHDLSGDASQLTLLCMIRLECRRDVKKRGLDRSRPAPCERGDQSFGTRRCQSSPFAWSSGQGEAQERRQ